MLDRRRPWVRRAGPGRSALIVVLAVLVVATAGVVGWMQLHQPAPDAAAGRFDPNVLRVATAPTTVPEPAVTTTVAPAPAPDPAPSLVDVPGSKLRRGVAHPVASPATIADVKGSKIGLYSTPGQAEA